MVDMDALLFPPDLTPRPAAVRAAIEIRVDGPDRVGPIRVDEDLHVVRRPASPVPRGLSRIASTAAPTTWKDLADPLPRCAGIVRAIESRLVDAGCSGRFRRGTAEPSAAA